MADPDKLDKESLEEMMRNLNEGIDNGRLFFTRNNKYVRIYYIIGNLAWIIGLCFKLWLLSFLLWLVFFPDLSDISGYLKGKLSKK